LHDVAALKIMRKKGYVATAYRWTMHVISFQDFNDSHIFWYHIATSLDVKHVFLHFWPQSSMVASVADPPEIAKGLCHFFG
jgi:hypothetical protein